MGTAHLAGAAEIGGAALCFFYSDGGIVCVAWREANKPARHPSTLLCFRLQLCTVLIHRSSDWPSFRLDIKNKNIGLNTGRI